MEPVEPAKNVCLWALKCLSLGVMGSSPAVLSTPVYASSKTVLFRFNLTMLGFTAAGLFIILAEQPAYFGRILILFPFVALPLLALSLHCHQAGWNRSRDLLLLLFWFITADPILGRIVQVFARVSFPLADHLLASADHLFGLYSGCVVSWFRAHPYWNRASGISYGAVQPLWTGAFFLQFLTGRSKAAYRLMVSTVAALWITCLLFMLLPAAGPWTEGAFQPTKHQASFLSAFSALRAGPADVEETGLITFPSFHVVVAVLAGLALWPIRAARYPAFLTSIAVCLSTVTTGWHYGVDVLGGVAVALFSWRAADLIISGDFRSTSSN